VDEVDAELDLLLARAGIVVPESLVDGVRAGHRELRRLAALLHEPRSVYDEPAAAYRIRVPDDLDD
jgi:hypothetical protein